MSQEILYTSAPQGLKPGSRGFCTVVSTSGMAKTLAERLESLSGYRHAYPQHDPRAAMNPVNYAHQVLSVAGRTYHVLSRIADAGADYTKRSNKLAHLVALEPGELVPGGPAWVLAGESFCETAWNGKTKILPAGRRPRTDDCPTGICRHWARLTGDAGWAGVLAESALANAKKPISVIFKPNTDTLSLVVEAMSLLPPERRWAVTFSTYFTQSGAECQWRFLLDGSQEANVARRNPHAPLIDLCKPLDKATGGELVELARSGRMPRSSVADTARPQPPPEETIDLRRPVGQAAMRATARQATPDSRLGLSPPLLAEPDGLPNLPPRGRLPFKRKSKLPMIALAAGLVVVMMMGMFLAYYAGTRRVSIALAPSEESSEKAQPDSSGAQPPPPPLPPAEDSASAEEAHEAAPEEPDSDQEPASDEMRDPDEATPDEAAPEDPQEELQNDTEPPPPEHPFADIRDRKLLLALPRREFQPGGVGTQSAELAKIFVSSPQDCNLTILGNSVVLDGGREFEVDLQDANGVRTWNVRTKSPGAIGAPPLIGVFRLKGNSLEFEWNRAAQSGARPGHLAYCLLQLEVDGQTELCRLNRPREVAPPKIDWTAKPPSVPIEIARDSLPPADYVRVDFTLGGFPAHELAGASGLKADGVGTIRVSDPGGAEDAKPLIEMEVRLQLAPPALVFEPSVHPTRRHPVSDKITQEKEPLTRSRLGGLEKQVDLAITDFDKKIRDATQNATGAQERIESIDAEIAKLDREWAQLRRLKDDPRLSQREQNEAENRTKGYPQAIKQLRENRVATEKARAELKEQIAAFNEWKAFFEENMAWCDRVREALDEITKAGTVSFALYIEVEGERVEIVRTRGDAP